MTVQDLIKVVLWSLVFWLALILIVWQLAW
jgi:hypothetical protein